MCAPQQNTKITKLCQFIPRISQADLETSTTKLENDAVYLGRKFSEVVTNNKDQLKASQQFELFTASQNFEAQAVKTCNLINNVACRNPDLYNNYSQRFSSIMDKSYNEFTAEGKKIIESAENDLASQLAAFKKNQSVSGSLEIQATRIYLETISAIIIKIAKSIHEQRI